MEISAESLGVYVSVPFCRAKCSFCNFASGVGTPEAIERYLALLCQEIREARATASALDIVLPGIIDTVYLGGGTPSLLSSEQLTQVFAALAEEFGIAAGAEITLEAAPGQIRVDLLDSALRLGVNRISLGVQSFVDAEAQAVGRTHTEASCQAEFDRLRRAGVRNLGADLIAGLPLQTERSWEHSLAVATGCNLQHLSVYMLEVDDDSRLGREVLGGGARLHAPAVPGDDLIAHLYERACDVLPSAGFAQYEISNFARAGYVSTHNSKYWRRAPYLGLGLDAHSMLLGKNGRVVRWANPEELSAYRGAASERAPQWVSEREAFEETVFLRLRLDEGLCRDDLNCYPMAWRKELDESAALLVREGMMEFDGDRWRLTRRGRLVSGEIFGELLAQVPA